MSEPQVFYELNILEDRAAELFSEGRVRDALRVYTFMADGDPSFGGGWFAEKFAECYERLGEPYMAKFWYGKAIEESGEPEIRPNCVAARERLEKVVNLDDLIAPELYVFNDEKKHWEVSRERALGRARRFDAARKAGKLA